jgi:hypothetical protein
MRKGKLTAKDFAPKVVIPCAHADCQEPAILSRKLPTGWANLCKAHDLFHVQRESNEFCRINGLDTFAKKREWIFKTLASPRPTPAEHWAKVLKTPGLIWQAYEMANYYFARHAPREINATAFTAPLEDEENEAAFAAYLAESAQIESDSPPG